MLTDISSIDPTSIMGLFKIAPFNPMDLVKQSSNNMMSQLLASDNVRGQLGSLQSRISLDVANTDLSAMKSYATDMLAHGQDMFVTGFTAPALQQIMPDALSNPLSSDLLGGSTGELNVSSLTQGLMGEGTNDLSGMLEGGLGDPTVSGAGMYISSMTGGIVLPSIASSVIDTVGDAAFGIVQGETPSLISLGGAFLGNTTSGLLGGSLTSALTGGSSTVTNALSNLTGGGDLTSTIASAVNGSSLGSGSLTNILGDTTSGSLFSDVTGGTFEGMMDTVMGKVGNAVVKTTADGSFNMDNLTNAASSLVNSVSGDVIGSVGGINLSDSSSIVDGLISKGIDAATSTGDSFSFSNLVSNFTGDKGIFSYDTISLAENMINNPYNLRNYTEILNTVGVDLGEILQTGASYGNSAVKAIADSVLDEETSNYVNGLLNDAMDSKMFNKLTNLGDHVLYDVLDDNTYRQLDALKSVGEIAMGGTSCTRRHNSGSRHNRGLVRAAEKIFNNGKAFGSGSERDFNFSSDITRAVNRARWLMK